MKQVLVKVSGGIIDEVAFFDNPLMVEKALVNFAKTMDPERDDAAIYDKKGLVANTKDILEENRQNTNIESNREKFTKTAIKGTDLPHRKSAPPARPHGCNRGSPWIYRWPGGSIGTRPDAKGKRESLEAVLRDPRRRSGCKTRGSRKVECRRLRRRFRLFTR